LRQPQLREAVFTPWFYPEVEHTLALSLNCPASIVLARKTTQPYQMKENKTAKEHIQNKHKQI